MMTTKARLLVRDGSRLDQFGGPIYLIDADLGEWVRSQLRSVLAPSVADLAEIGVRIDLTVTVNASEYITIGVAPVKLVDR